MDSEQLAAIVNEIEYKDWRFITGKRGDELFLQVKFLDNDIDTGNVVEQPGRKWWISRFMTKSEVVQTTFLACLKAEEHECRERFLYKGESIYCPHYSVDELLEFTKNASRDKRK